MPTNKPEVVLPELPEPVDAMALAAWGPKPDYYTADQLRAYGQACYEAGRAAQAKHHQQQVGHLPADAVAWLDMGKGEAQLMFGKRDASNRANKRQIAMLFEKVNPGYHPLYLHPQKPDTLTRPADGEFVMVPDGWAIERTAANEVRVTCEGDVSVMAREGGAYSGSLAEYALYGLVSDMLSAAPQQGGQEAFANCCDTPAYCSSVRRCTRLDEAKPQQPAEAVAVALPDVSDAEIAEWLERHDLAHAIRGADARAAFEDAQSFVLTKPVIDIEKLSRLKVTDDIVERVGYALSHADGMSYSLEHYEDLARCALNAAIIDSPPPAIDIGKLRELGKRIATNCEAEAEWHKDMNAKYDWDTEHAAWESRNRIDAVDLRDFLALIGDGGEAKK